MITTLNDFQVGFNVHDGEVASAAVLSRPTNRLKTEILEVNTLLGVIINDPSKIPDWIAGTYEVGNIVKYLGKTWKALAITSATPGSNPLLWSDISLLAASFADLSSGADATKAYVDSLIFLPYVFVATASQTVFITTGTKLSPTPLVFLNGVLQTITDVYTVQGLTVTFLTGLSVGESVVILG